MSFEYCWKWFLFHASQIENKQTNAKWREPGERRYHTTPISTANIDSALYKLGLLCNETSCISLQITTAIHWAIKSTAEQRQREREREKEGGRERGREFDAFKHKRYNLAHNENPQSPIHSILHRMLFFPDQRKERKGEKEREQNASTLIWLVLTFHFSLD